MAKNFVQLYRWLVPGWLRWGEGDGVLLSLSQLLDEYTMRLRDGIARRFPSYAADANDDVALAMIGKDRGIIRGRSETTEHYAARLVEWRYPRGHRVRGSAFALLTQISEYFGGVQCWTVDANGTRHARSAAGEEYFDYGSAWDWDDRPDEEVYRFWVVLDGSSFAGEQPDFGDPTLWADAGGTIGQTGVAAEDVRAMRRLMTGRAWRPAGTQPMWVIVTLTPILGTTLPAPDATWKNWSRNVGGTQVATRSPLYRYWSLDPEHTSQYAGDPDNYPQEMEVAGLGSYSGSLDNFPATITLAGGVGYAGNPNSFPAYITLPDDGSPAP
jgi:hypothetical protein